MSKKFDVIFLVDSGIGNVLQTLYAVEYLLRQNNTVGCYLGKVNKSFRAYLKTCYKGVIIDDLNEVSCTNLIHGFTYQATLIPNHTNYYYISSEKHPALHYSETEQFLNVVTGLYTGGQLQNELSYLVSDYSEKVKELAIENKTIVYHGGSSINSSRRWPHYPSLIEKLGNENCIIIGGKDDLNFKHSYIYPKALTSVPQAILNKKQFWKVSKNSGLLKKWSHHNLHLQKNAYFNKFNWAELVALFSSAEKFVGNDGGLSHLAGACGIKGLVLFGPTSAKKISPSTRTLKFFEQLKAVVLASTE